MDSKIRRLLDVFFIFLRLGLTSFGGPVAHLGYFHEEFVNRKKWIDEHTYADLIALCQLLPGPSSSQVGIAIGLMRVGYFGSICAWLGFTLPSAIILVLFGLGISHYHIEDSWLHGLKIAAVAIVAQAIWMMGRKLCPDWQRLLIGFMAAVIVFMNQTTFVQLSAIFLGGFIGLFFLRKEISRPHIPFATRVSRNAGITFLTIFTLLLILLPILAKTNEAHSVKMFDSFFRAGSLVFGGGHVVLPLLQAEVVPPGWITKELFMAGYGAAQAVPGPLVTFAAYLGSISSIPPSGWLGALICLTAAFLPSFLLIFGAIPFWEQLRQNQRLRFAMQGINASVVGLLAASFCHPVWTSAIFDLKDFGLAIFALLLLMFMRAPTWSVVLLTVVIAKLIL